MTLPLCPQCNARMIPNPDGSGLWCQFCGVIRADGDAVDLRQEYEQANPSVRDYDPPTRDFDMDPLLARVLDDAWSSIRAGNLQEARFILNANSSRHGDSPDLWYLLALCTSGRTQRLAYLEKALTLQPYHEYAWREKGVLEGVIPTGEPAPTPDPAGPVEAESETEACPLCGGALAFDAAADTFVCHHCGHQPGTPVRAPVGGYDKLDNALLQRRFGFSKEWRIGERVLVCQNCHAQLTLSGSTFSTQCPFCDSAHILIQDSVGSFEEPDALLPFAIDRQRAARAVHARLPAGTQVERGDLVAVYLPFWDFTGLVSILIPYMANPPAEVVRPGAYGIDRVLVGGVARPGQAVLADLMPYHLSRLVPYDPRYLARWSAQTYSMDVIQASITARAYMKYAARQQATGWRPPEIDLARTDDHNMNPPNTPLWQAARITIEGINYRLLLLPVWMVTLYLTGGARRPAVVNGQTGEAIILDSFEQPDRIIAGPVRRSTVIRPIKM